MTYASLEHFRDVTSRNVLALQEAKEKGRKVVGQFCIYSPLEIALAAGAVPVSLCGTKQDSIPVAEEVLPRCLCPLIKSSFGFALQDSCPYLAASDIVVADATCDGKKKMYELLAAYKPVMLLQLPQIQDERAHAYWREQYALLVARLEQDFGVRITEEKLRAAMDLTSRLRQALKKVLDLAVRRLCGGSICWTSASGPRSCRIMSRPSGCWRPSMRNCRMLRRLWLLMLPASC